MKPIALITGSNRGLGLETARLLAGKHFQVIMTARDEDQGERACNQLRDLGLAVVFQALDLNKSHSFSRVNAFVASKFGHLDVLINNAAVHYDQLNQVTSPDFQIVEEAMTINLVNTWKLTAQLLPLLRKSKHGRIVNVSSEAGSITNIGAGAPAYAISKAGLNVLTIKLAKALLDHGILVNAVCPGWVRTDMGGPNAPRSVSQGAASIAWAATLPDDGPTGGFFRDGKPIAF